MKPRYSRAEKKRIAKRRAANKVARLARRPKSKKKSLARFRRRFAARVRLEHDAAMRRGIDRARYMKPGSPKADRPDWTKATAAAKWRANCQRQRVESPFWLKPGYQAGKLPATRGA